MIRDKNEITLALACETVGQTSGQQILPSMHKREIASFIFVFRALYARFAPEPLHGVSYLRRRVCSSFDLPGDALLSLSVKVL